MSSTYSTLYRETCGRTGVTPRPQIIEALEAAATTGGRVGSVELVGSSKELFANRINDADVEAFVTTVISGGIPLDGLYLLDNSITDKGLATLARLFQDSGSYTCSLQALDLRRNSVTSVGCRALMEALISSRNRTLLTLNLNGNGIGDEGGVAVAEWLQTNPSLIRLDLGNTELETDAVIALSTVLQSNVILQELSLENPRLFSRMEDTMYHIARMLRVNKGLVSLNLSKNRIGDFGAKLLSEYLGDNSTLRALNLRCNSISSVGGVALASLFLRGSPIEDLNLDANRIGDDGGEAFAVTLRRCNTLLSLDLRRNSIGDKGLVALAHAFVDNVTLQQFWIWGNDFGQPAVDAFATQYYSSFRSTGITVDIRPYEGAEGLLLAEESA